MAEPPYCGVIETATGDLLRSGYCNFENDGSFNAAAETQRMDIPRPPKIRGSTRWSTMHRWTGSEWTEVAQPV